MSHVQAPPQASTHVLSLSETLTQEAFNVIGMVVFSSISYFLSQWYVRLIKKIED